ncbi:TIGR01777 family protein [Phytoactinopolyspora halotolerans]|uniref:TIGR01777 family protein n=2 Tax=Phytoactinopolyspora halotolerans TaxID=1981512 RepID=A0A6L9SA06_9ACTN|nr:TIGR01777 family protein [Phytoactinopolyspora halotolerans]
MPASVEGVFAWHARPGAISRLTPPWQPVRVAEEALSLRDGRARLRLPGGLTWAAAHQPDGYDPPRQFVDQLASSPFSRVLSWRHTHEFTPDDGGTRVTDVVETSVPEAVLRSMFRYRHAQLAEDLAAQERSRRWQTDALTVAITGSSGLVGTAVAALLSTAGHRVIRLVRRSPRGQDERQWNPESPDTDLLAGVDAVIHLAGASIGGRFTESHKREIRDSRIGPTHRLAQAAAAAPSGPHVFVSASAIGFYGSHRGDELLTEDHERGDGFLADVVADWEAATAPAAGSGIRCVQVRTGIVQTPRGGTLQLLYPMFFAGLGGRLGDGTQWLSWIGIDDLADIYLRSVCDADLHGPLNAVAPTPVRNAEYTRTLARVLRRPALVPVPGLGPRLLLGQEGAEELALASQRVAPGVLAGASHVFRHPDLEHALRHVLGRLRATDAPQTAH